MKAHKSESRAPRGMKGRGEWLGPHGAAALEALGLADARALLDVQAEDVARSTPHRRTLHLQVEGLDAYLKLYAPGAGRIGKISRRHAAAAVELCSLLSARDAGIPVPEPLAAVWGERGDRDPSAILLRAVPGGERLDHLLEPQAEPRPSDRAWLERELVPLVARLHAAGFQHRDLYACHLLRDADTGGLVLIDLARLRHQPRLARRRRIKDLAALAYSLGGVLRRAELRRLLQLYCEAAPTPLHAPSLARAVLRKARRIAAHRPRYG
jgi:heptose I phosphotransferase